MLCPFAATLKLMLFMLFHFHVFGNKHTILILIQFAKYVFAVYKIIEKIRKK